MVLVLRITEVIVMGPCSLKIKRVLGKVYSARVIDVTTRRVGRQAWTVDDGVIGGGA
jgi:hypothetical protein